jgi:quinol monooxygenase YgiN
MILKVQPKNARDLEAVYARMTQNARGEDGTITFRMFRADDGTTYFYDDYASSEAFLSHLGNAQTTGVMDDFMAAGDVTEVLCLGSPTADARGALAQFGAVCAGHVSGFSRLELEPASA